MGKNKLIKSHKGFTLVELLVTIAILSILATVSVVGFTSLIEKSAVSTDGHYVASLNNLLNIYKVGHRENIDEYELKEMFEKENITGPNIQSEKYGYTLYFNTQSQKFELSQEKLTGDKYIAINEDFFADTTTPDDSQGGLGDDENNNDVTSPSDGENDENSSESEPDLESEPNLVLQDYEEIHDETNTYIDIKDGIINVGIYINDDSELIPTILDVSKISIVDINSNTRWNIINIKIDDKIVNDQIDFEECGVKIINITVKLGETEKNMLVTVKVFNVFLKDAVIEAYDNRPVCYIYKDSDNGTYRYEFVIMEDVNIIDNDIQFLWNSRDNSEKAEIISRLKVFIYMDGKEYIIDMDNAVKEKNIDMYKSYVAIIDNVEFDSLPSGATIIYHYQGRNGVWVSSGTVEIN